MPAAEAGYRARRLWMEDGEVFGKVAAPHHNCAVLSRLGVGSIMSAMDDFRSLQRNISTGREVTDQ